MIIDTTRTVSNITHDDNVNVCETSNEQENSGTMFALIEFIDSLSGISDEKSILTNRLRISAIVLAKTNRPSGICNATKNNVDDV